MNDIFLFNIKKQIIEEVEHDAINKIYYFEAVVPNKEQIDHEINKNLQLKNFVDKFKSTDLAIEKIKKNISEFTNEIPLFDIKTKNLYLIKDKDLYNYVMHLQYRFPDKHLIKEINNIKKNLEIDKNKDVIHLRTLRKFKLMFKFWNQLDIEELYKTYIKVFYEKNIGKNIITCVRSSYIPYFLHLKPYYTTNEVINLSLNMELIKENEIGSANIEELCRIVVLNDISANMLLKHQKHIENNDTIGLIQYYTVQGSSLMNRYLRNLTTYSCENKYLEKQIVPMWNLIKKAPAFDNDYIVYRFVSTDKFLKYLNIGDTYIEPGFMSTTRDPFYRPVGYDFGTVLIKIKIPKDIIGVALCVETYSHFPEEQEIIFPPRTHFKLIHKFNDINYYYDTVSNSVKIEKKYEFEWIKSDQVKFIGKTKFTGKTKNIDFSQLIELDTSGLTKTLNGPHSIIEKFISTYVNEMDLCRIQIGNKLFDTFVEYYDGLGAYKNFYALKIKNGFALYSFFKKYLLFIIEIGTVNNEIQLHVNYYTKYNRLRRDKIIRNIDFADFLANVGYYFHAQHIIIYADYVACKSLSKNILLQNVEQEISLLSGNYCIDFYNYFKFNIKRYDITGTIQITAQKYFSSEKINKINSVELFPKYSFENLDKLKTISPHKILYKFDNDELYQIYVKSYIVDGYKDSIAAFFVWLVENKCYLIDIFLQKIKRIMNDDNNPFINDYYIFNGNYYLYNRHKLLVYPQMNFISVV
jgi:hypothetical protein